MAMEGLFVTILVILVVARLAGELMERLGQASILGELIAGVSLGFVITNFPSYMPGFDEIVHNDVFRMIQDLGIFFLMFMTGLEMRLRRLVEASKKGSIVALGGVALPFALGYGIGELYLPGSELKFAQLIFLGVSLSITAIAVSAKVLVDLRAIHTKVGHTIISAAVIDDIAGLGMLAVLTSILEFGKIPSGLDLVVLSTKISVFFILTAITGRFIIPRLAARIHRMRAREFQFTAGLTLALLFAVAAENLGMHFMIGAFIAGLFIQEGTFGAKAVKDIQDRVSGITLGFLAPIFFASIGLQLDLSAFTSTLSLTFALLLLSAAIAGKLIGCGFTARLVGFSNRDSVAIGVGMNGRGAVELIVADIALQAGLFASPTPVPPIVSAIFSSVVFIAIATTFMTPILLRFSLTPIEEVE